MVEGVLASAPGEGWVVVDERCPGLDAATLQAVLGAAASDARPRVGTRPVTDTVKRLKGGLVIGSVDRAGLLQLASPLVVPGAVEPQGATLAEMAEAAVAAPVEVPAGARRLTGAELQVLALDD